MGCIIILAIIVLAVMGVCSVQVSQCPSGDGGSTIVVGRNCEAR